MADSQPDDIATDKLDELRRATADKFSAEELDSFITAGKKLSSKPILTLLTRMIEAGPASGGNTTESVRLVKKVARLFPYNYCGYTSLSFAEIPHILNICLSIVPANYKTDIDIPPGYENDLFAQYNFIKQIALTYYAQFTNEHPELMKRIAAYLPDVDFTALTIDPANPTTLYIDPRFDTRIGIFCYYMLNGKPFYKTAAGDNSV